MKQIIKKISAIAVSTLMMGMSMGVAAAANYPSPFVVGSTADVAIVYGTGTGVSSLDMVQAANIQSDLSTRLGTTGGAGGSVTGGDSVLLAKTSDNLNINNTWGVFTGTITDDDLSTLLVDGTYSADDNDEFDYEQRITVGTPELKHFRDSDYESLVGLTDKTPVIGFKIGSSTAVLNYTLEFLEDVSTDYVSLRADDIEGSDLPLMGKTYYVSELNNGSSTTSFGKLVLLDAANTGNVKEGETATVTGHQVSIDWIDPDEVVFLVDGERVPASGKLQKGNSYKLDDGSYLGVRDISAKDVSGTVGSASFSIGTGKLEFPSFGSDIKMNDESISGLKGYVVKSTGEKLDKVIIEWKTDEESFLTPDAELLMPGFGALKFTMNKLIRNEEEKISIVKDGDTSIQLQLPIKKGNANLNLLYSNSTGDFIGIGEDAENRLLTSANTSIRFFEKSSGNDYHAMFVATYNISKEGETYLLKADISQDVSAGRNETDILSYEDGSWVVVCDEKTLGDTCNIGDISLTISTINYISGGNQSAELNASTNVNFNSVMTAGGLVFYLPWTSTTSDIGNYLSGGELITQTGYINFTNVTNLGRSTDSWWLHVDGEDKDGNSGAGMSFNLTLDDSSNKVQVSQVNHAGAGGGSTYGAEEVGASTAVYQVYLKDDVAPKILHYTKSDDDDYAEIYYPSGESETYAEVFLTESGAVLVPGAGSSGNLGEILVKDTEVSSVSSKNLVVVGGSCINSVAANLVGGAYCGSAWTEKTGVGSGEFLIKSYSGKYAAGKIALLVAGYEAADTVAATTALKNKVVDTAKEYKGTTSTTTVTEVTAA